MKLNLIIDTRESGSVAADLDRLGTPYEIRSLSVGDFALEDKESGATLALWERKSCSDLAASINDGRYNEQKGRLKAKAQDCPYVGYILEGYYPVNGICFPKPGGKKGIVPRATIDSVKLGLTLRDGFTVYELADSSHTAVFLTKMLSKIPEYLNETESMRKNKYEDSLIKSMSTVRKDNMTPELCYLSQLCQIPGISHNIAQGIQSHYPNMLSLLKNINDVKKLASIKCTESRKLGNVLAQRLYDYMAGENVNAALEAHEIDEDASPTFLPPPPPSEIIKLKIKPTIKPITKPLSPLSL